MCVYWHNKCVYHSLDSQTLGIIVWYMEPASMYVHSYHENDLVIKSCYMHMVATPYSVAYISISGDCCAYDNDVDEIPPPKKIYFFCISPSYFTLGFLLWLQESQYIKNQFKLSIRCCERTCKRTYKDVGWWPHSTDISTYQRMSNLPFDVCCVYTKGIDALHAYDLAWKKHWYLTNNYYTFWALMRCYALLCKLCQVWQESLVPCSCMRVGDGYVAHMYT